MAGINTQTHCSEDAENPLSGSPLFKNMKFWLSKSVPQRAHMKHQIEAYGGRVVILEKDADVLLVDHLRKDNPPGTYSYQFVERSIRLGLLQELNKFLVGMPRGSVRQPAMGPAKRYREPFTAKDDQILYDWMKPFEQAGGAVSGNKIYQKLEAQHPSHTWQSWRERYLKKVRGLPRPGSAHTGPDSSTPGQSGPQPETPKLSIPASQLQYGGFTERDMELLLRNAPRILMVSPDAEDEMWSEIAENEDKHSAMEWKNYFHTFVRPIYESKLKNKKNTKSRHSNISGTTERIHADADTMSDEQKGGIGGDIQMPKGKRRRTLPDSFRPADLPTRVDDQNQNKRRATGSSPSQSFTANQLTVSSPLPATTRPGIHEPDMRSQRYETTSEAIAQKQKQSSPLVPRTQTTNVEEHSPMEDGAQEVDEWIRSRVQRSQGLLSEDQVRKALRCTTMDDVLADKVLGYFQAGKGIPTNMRGVWTEEDDAAIQGEDPRAIAHVEEKHGREEFDARFEHLMELCEELYGALYLTDKAYTIPPDNWLPL
ncbi:hypothetical protein MaudCBS49596_003149 [Microsporum audouinii]